MVNDSVLLDAVFWLLMSNNFPLYLIGSITFVALIISFFYTIRKWGEI